MGIKVRKQNIVVLSMIGVLLTGGCSSVVEEMEERASEQAEWTEKNHARTDGKSQQEVLEDTIGDFIGDPNFTFGEQAEKTVTGGKYKIGETVKMKNDTTKIDLTLTEWGTVYDTLSEEILTYVSFSVTNTGEGNVYVYNDMFNVYADDYSAKYTSWFDDDSNTPFSADLSPGRKFNGTFYLQLDPDDVSNIEVELGDVVFVVKDETTQETNKNADNNAQNNINTPSANSPKEADNAGMDSSTDGGYVALEDYLDFSLSAESMEELLQSLGLDFAMDESFCNCCSGDGSVMISNTDLGGCSIEISPSEDNRYSLFGVSCGMSVEDAWNALEEYGAVEITSPTFSVDYGVSTYTLFDSYTMTISYDEDWSKIEGISFDCYLW